MPRVRSQLALQLPPELIARIRAEADARGQTLTTMVRSWLEAALGAPSGPAAGAVALAALEARLAALEARLAALEQPPTRSPRPGPALALPPPPTDGAITTGELAERLGMKRGTINERVRRAGGARVGLVMDGWRCVGQAPAPGGGPLRWLWEPA